MKLPAIISNNMVLQKEHPIKIWGWDTPGEKVTVTLLGHTSTSTVGTEGKWVATLPPMSSNEPANMEVSGS